MPEEDDATLRRMVAALRATADLLEAELPPTPCTCHRPALRLVRDDDADPGPPTLPRTA